MRQDRGFTLPLAMALVALVSFYILKVQRNNASSFRLLQEINAEKTSGVISQMVLGPQLTQVGPQTYLIKADAKPVIPASHKYLKFDCLPGQPDCRLALSNPQAFYNGSMINTSLLITAESDLTVMLFINGDLATKHLRVEASALNLLVYQNIEIEQISCDRDCQINVYSLNSIPQAPLLIGDRIALSINDKSHFLHKSSYPLSLAD